MCAVSCAQQDRRLLPQQLLACALPQAEEREREEQDGAADKAAVLALAAEVERAKAMMAQMMQELEEVSAGAVHLR